MTEHPVQTAALSAGIDRPGFAYFMEQGLGKTYTALKDFEDKVKKRLATRLVVICPNSFKGGWEDEMDKWGFLFDLHIYDAGAARENAQWLRKEYNKPPVLVINYESIRMAGTKKDPRPSAGIAYVEEFIHGKNAMIVADESIQISTHDAAQTKGALHLARQFRFRRILSGKPIKQGPHDLWSQMRFIGNLDGFNYFAFKNAFCKMGGFQGRAVVGSMNEDILAERMKGWVFDARKKDWTNLPPKTYTIREYDLGVVLKSMYKQMENEFVVWLQSGEQISIDAAITKYIKLAQIQAGFMFREDKSVEWIVPPERNPRLSALLDYVDNELVGKAIIVYNHKPVRDLLKIGLEQRGKVVFIHGNMTDDEISESKRRFNEDRSVRFICITKAAKYGHTLLGNQDTPEDACATEVFFENTYSLDDRGQLEDRPHRHGQLQDSMGYVDFAGTPLDRNCVKALQRKEGIFQAVFKAFTDRR